MTTHLSARLVWHDRGWDGCVCDAPHLNASCIVHDHLRDSRDDEKEREAAGRTLGDLNGWLLPMLPPIAPSLGTPSSASSPFPYPYIE